MSYRSDVTIAFKSLDHTVSVEWAKLLIKQPPFMKTILADEWLKGLIECEPGSDTWVFKAERVNWNDSYDQIEAMETLWTYFDELDYTNNTFMGLYIRIGDESDDIEERTIGNGYELGGVVRTIELTL